MNTFRHVVHLLYPLFTISPDIDFGHAHNEFLQAAIDLADKWLNLMRLEIEVYTDNAPAIRLYEKFGFAIEGTLVDFAFRDGQYVDTYTMARLRKTNA